MGSVLMIVCVMVAMAGLALRVQADYHVSALLEYIPGSGTTPSERTFVACPSFDCNCYRHRDFAGRIYEKPPSLSDSFSIFKFCGYKQLDHYHNGNGTYSAYVAGDHGKAVATCVAADKGKVTLKCSEVNSGPGYLYDYLICKGKVCNHGSQHQH